MAERNPLFPHFAESHKDLLEALRRPYGERKAQYGYPSEYAIRTGLRESPELKRTTLRGDIEESIRGLDRRFFGPMVTKAEDVLPGLHETAGILGPEALEAPPQVPGQLGPGYHFDLGAAPSIGELPPAPTIKPADFTGAIEALGAEPKPVEGPGKLERLGQVLSGAAGGAERGLRIGPGGQGGTVASVLAGAGAEAGSALARVRDREDRRQFEWRQRVQAHRKTAAAIETRAASAKSDNERYEAALAMQQQQMEFQREKFNETMNAPIVHVNGGSVTTVQTNPETGRREGTTLDMDAPYKEMSAMARMRAAKGEDITFYHGQFVKASAVKTLGTEVWMLHKLARTSIETGEINTPEFRPLVDEGIRLASGRQFESLEDLNSEAALRQIPDEKIAIWKEEAMVHAWRTILSQGQQQPGAAVAPPAPSPGLTSPSGGPLGPFLGIIPPASTNAPRR